MRRTLLLIALTAGCAEPRGAWPDLAKRAVETAVEPGPSSNAAATQRTSGASGPSPGGDVAVARAAYPATPMVGDAMRDPVVDIGSELATLTRDVAGLEVRVARQRDVAARASGTTAQLESGRLSKLGGEVAVMRDRLDAASGRLAVAAGHGGDVVVALRAAGALIERADRLAAACRPAGRPG